MSGFVYRVDLQVTQGCFAVSSTHTASCFFYTRAVAKHVKKGDLPQKICLHCDLPFTWRKKWARDWENVRYCSERCKREGKKQAATA